MRSRSPNAHPTMTTINERAESRKRICYFLFGLISSVVSFCLICVSLATNYWVQSEPYKNSSVQDISAITKGKGFLHFGLFRVSESCWTGMDQTINSEITLPTIMKLASYEYDGLCLRL